MLATVYGQQSYEYSLTEFINCVADQNITLEYITAEIVAKYVEHLKTTRIAVETHKKIIRPCKSLKTLKSYYTGTNSFNLKNIL